MNFLVHLFLSENHPESHTGAVLGDFLRGVDRTKLPTKIEQGVQHHLSVDSFTDSHKEIHALKRLFSSKRQRFSGIIIDVLFDHFLIQKWENYSTLSIESSIETYHQSLLSTELFQPERMRYLVSLLIQHDILRSYRSVKGVETALNRIGDRFSRPTPFRGSIDEIRKNYDELEVGFTQFFPLLIEQFIDGKC